MTIIDVVRLIRKNIATLLVSLIVGVLLAVGWTYTRPVAYQASATGLVVAGSTGSVSGATSGDLLAQQRAVAYTKLLGTRALHERTAQNLATQNPSLVAGGYVATVVPGTAFITLTATADTALAAKATADAALQALIAEALRLETYGAVQTAETPPNDLRRLTAIHVLPYEPAVQPSAPKRIGLQRNLLFGLAAGALLGIAGVLIRRYFDIKVRTQSDVEELTGHAVIGVIPNTKISKQDHAGRDLLAEGAVGESLRKLRTNLRFVNVDQPPRSLVVTSANPSEGKSTIVASLARLMAMSGEQVVIVDCDLRRPTQASIFGIDSGIGVTQVLSGDIAVADALLPTGTPGLKLLPAGRIPPNPSELIGSRKLADLIHELAKEYRVLIDAPPLLAVTDAALLSAITDGAIFVTSVGKTPKEQVRVCVRQLELVGAQMLGSVMNRVPKKEMGDVLYGYGHGNYGSAQSEQYYQVAQTQHDARSQAQLAVDDPVGVGVTNGRRFAGVDTSSDKAN